MFEVVGALTRKLSGADARARRIAIAKREAVDDLDAARRWLEKAKQRGDTRDQHQAQNAVTRAMLAVLRAGQLGRA